MLGSGKEKHGDFAGMDGALLVSRLDPDPDDAQDAVGLRRAWPYFLSHSILGFGTSSSSDKSPDVDASENDGYGRNGEREQLSTS